MSVTTKPNTRIHTDRTDPYSLLTDIPTPKCKPNVSTAQKAMEPFSSNRKAPAVHELDV